MRKIVLIAIALLAASITHADTLTFAGGILSLETSDWLHSISREQYSKLHPKKRYPQSYHETKDGKVSLYSELDRASQNKTIADIHKEAVELQNQLFEDTLSWNRKDIVTISGKEFSLLDFNIKDPDGDEEFTFRMIVIDGIVNDQVSHTVVMIHDKDAEKLYVEKFYSWLGLK